MEEQIIKLNDYINKYYKTDLDGVTLNELGKNISALLYYLESVRSEIHNEFQIQIDNLIDEGNSVARATNKTHVLYPAMYQLRHLMKAGYEVLGMIRTNISFIKQEMNNNLQN
tara:strand:+ start:178 stop:516 length:339 start_codon:yes stop_codon:yes gene_type:complete